MMPRTGVARTSSGGACVLMRCPRAIFAAFLRRDVTLILHSPCKMPVSRYTIVYCIDAQTLNSNTERVASAIMDHQRGG